jgi:hypothetical protein
MQFKYSKLIFAALFLMTVLSCKDESLNPIPVWEPGVRGWGRGPVAVTAGDRFAGQDFSAADVTKGSPIKFRWISHDGKITINKVELYLFFDEIYKDRDGNFPTARHAGSYGAGLGGKLWKTLEGATLKGNDEDIDIVITQQDVYNVFKDVTFDYKGDPAIGAVKIFENPERPQRTAANPFIADGPRSDKFRISWKLYGTNGRVYDSFGDGVCAEELPLGNCFELWSIK